MITLLAANVQLKLYSLIAEIAVCIHTRVSSCQHHKNDHDMIPVLKWIESYYCLIISCFMFI